MARVIWSFSSIRQVGAWGCFDEFNRLEERILSAVSQQILAIQKGLLNRQPKVKLAVKGQSVDTCPAIGHVHLESSQNIRSSKDFIHL